MRGAVAALAAILAWPRLAGAQSADDSPPVSVELTDATTLIDAWKNRDFAPNDNATVVNDGFGVWYNRLHAQISRGPWRFGVRVDNAWYYRSPNPTATALTLVDHRPPTPGGLSDPAYFRLKVQQTGRELSNRYINWVYPAKIFASYSERAYELTLGDVYAELGHGMVLSVRKRDELASDDTIRGARASGLVSAGGVRVRLTALGGSLNPLRIDEGSGRYLGVDSSVKPGFLALTEAGMPHAVRTDFAPRGEDCASSPTCTYAPDRIAAAELGFDFGRIVLSTQGSLLVRQTPLSTDVVRRATHITTASESATLTTSDGKGSLALEAAGQKLAFDDGDTEMPAGFGGFLSGSYDLSPVVLLVEARHYRRFFPLAANVDVSGAREFSQVAWSAPPTTEESYIDTEFGGFSSCVTGGRTRADYALSRGISTFGWVGYYQTFGERASNDRCEPARHLRNDVFDLASGFELRSRDGRSRATFTAGARFDDTADPFATPEGPTNVYYRELYARYDVVKTLGGPFALELQGWHRRRHETLGPQLGPWLEGEHVTGIDYGAAWFFAVGTEYNSDIRPPTTYLNGNVRWKPSSDSSIGLFVGQRRGSLRCVGGVCRVVPGLEGVRLDASVRF